MQNQVMQFPLSQFQMNKPQNLSLGKSPSLKGQEVTYSQPPIHHQLQQPNYQQQSTEHGDSNVASGNNNLQNVLINCEKLKIDNQNLKQRLSYFEEMIQNVSKFESTKNLLDLKSFVASNYKKYSELLDEMYLYKHNYKADSKSVGTGLDTNNKENLNQIQQLQQQQQQIQMQNANQNFYLNKIKELEEKQEQNSKEIQTLKDNNKKLNDQMTKKDFFREYDFMCKEVEGLRKQNMMMTEQIKKLQQQTTTQK